MGFLEVDMYPAEEFQIGTKAGSFYLVAEVYTHE
jgi:hypothetical protein